MPKRIAEKNKTNIYCSYKIGELNKITKYTTPIMLSGQFVSLKGNKSPQYYGIDMKYDGIIIVEENNQTVYLDEFTKIWINNEPVENSSADYKIQEILPPKDGLKTIYVSSTVKNNSNLWCLYEDGNIYKIDCQLFENNNNEYKYNAVFPINTYLEINYNTKIWYEEPIDKNDTNSLLELALIKQNKFNVVYCLKEVI